MKRRRDSEYSKRIIIDIAEKEFSEKGLYGARVDSIAEKAEINKRMIYVYFGSKVGLYKQVLSKVYERMNDVENALLQSKYKGTELVKRIISLYFDFLKSNPTFVNLLMWENLNKGRYLSEIENSKIQRVSISYFIEEFKRCRDNGIFNPDIDPEQVAISLITICFANFSNQ